METVDAILTSGDRNKPNTFETWIQSRVLQRPIFWWIVSIVGVAVGLIGFGLSSNLKHLLGDPKPWKNVGYTLFCVTVFVLVIVLHQLKGSKKVLPFRRQFKACGVFLALLVIIIYTFFSRRGEEQEQQWKGHNDTPNNIQVAGIVSLVGFAVMAFALSIQTNYGFIGELMKFFLEELVVELTKIRWWFGFFGALFSFLLIILRSCKEKHAEGDVHQDPINNNTTPLQDIRTDSLSTVRPTQDLFTLALQNLNEKDLELSQNLRRHLIGYINYWSDQIPEGIMQDQNFIKDRIMREVETLHLIVNQMTSRDNFEMDNWLPTMYFRSRKQFLRKCESELKPDNSTAQVSRIKNWIKYCNIVLKILIPNERILCQQVFGEFSPISSKCFEQLCLQVKQDLLSFIQGIPELMSPEIVLVFRIVRDLIVPEFRSLFTRNLDMTIEMFDLTKKLGEATRDYYFRDDDVPPEIENSHSCEPHPITICWE
ncbi:Exocyst complex component [Arachis hypogaea]|nr:Exocyst complex component [Arachis hypogaea]